MEPISEQTAGTSLASHTSGFLAPPVHVVLRSKTGGKPQRSSPLARLAVLVDDGEDTLSVSRVSFSSSLDDQCESLSYHTPPRLVPHRPKSMVSDYSNLSLYKQSLTPRSRPHAPGTKQLIRPISSILPLSATREDLFDAANSSCPQEVRTFGDPHSGCNPLTRSTNQRTPLSITQLKPPTILINDEKSIELPQIPFPAPARSTSRTTETLPRDNSWYITNAYEETPRFSRLGLSGNNVVLPLSAKEYKKCQQQRPQHAGHSFGNKTLSRSSTVNTGGNSASNLTKSPSSNKRSSLMGRTLASALKLTRSNTSTRTSSDHELAQEPPPSSPSLSSTFTQPSLSSRASNSSRYSERSSLPSSATSSLCPHSSLSRTRTSSLAESASSSYTCFMPDVATSSSRPSFKDPETTSPIMGHGKDTQQARKTPTTAAVQERSRNLLVSKRKRRIVPSDTLPGLDPAAKDGVPSPAVNKLRRTGTFRKFITLFISS